MLAIHRPLNATADARKAHFVTRFATINPETDR
jgi:hypothetical protein